MLRHDLLERDALLACPAHLGKRGLRNREVLEFGEMLVEEHQDVVGFRAPGFSRQSIEAFMHIHRDAKRNGWHGGSLMYYTYYNREFSRGQAAS